jgi:hypothetical protein
MQKCNMRIPSLKERKKDLIKEFDRLKSSGKGENGKFKFPLSSGDEAVVNTEFNEFCDVTFGTLACRRVNSSGSHYLSLCIGVLDGTENLVFLEEWTVGAKVFKEKDFEKKVTLVG